MFHIKLNHLLALCLFGLGAFFPAQAHAEGPGTFTAIIPTDRKPVVGPRDGIKQGPMAVTVSGVSLAGSRPSEPSLSDIFVKMAPILALNVDKSDKGPVEVEVAVYVDPRHTAEERAKLAVVCTVEAQKAFEAAQRKVEQHTGKAQSPVKVKILIRDLDEAAVDINKVAASVSHIMDDLAKAYPDDPNIQKLAQLAPEAALEALKETRDADSQGLFNDLRRRWDAANDRFNESMAPLGTPAAGRKVVALGSKIHAGMMAVIFGGIAINQASGQWNPLLGLSLVAFPTAVQYFNMKFQNKMIERFKKMGLPRSNEFLAKHFDTATPEGMRHALVYKRFAEYLNSATCATITFLGLRNAAIHELLHLYNPVTNVPVTFGSAFTSMLATAPWLYVSYASIIAQEIAHERGNLSRPAIDWLRKVGGAFDVIAMGAWNAFEATHFSSLTAGAVYGVAQAAATSLQLFAVHQALKPARTNRMVVVEEGAKSLEGVHAVEGLPAARSVRFEDLDKEVGRAMEYDKIPTRASCIAPLIRLGMGVGLATGATLGVRKFRERRAEAAGESK